MSTTTKPSRGEDEYFAKQDVEVKRRLAREVREKLHAKEREQLKQIHYMHCPKCGLDLQNVTFQGFIIEKCFECGTIVLAESEFEKLAGGEEGFITAIVGLFK